MTPRVRVLLVVPGVPPQVTAIDRDLAGFRAAIGGGWVEAIRGESAGREWSGYCDEEGKVKGLPVNQVATRIAAKLGWYGAGTDVLCGVVVFVGPLDEEGNDTDLPDWVLAELRG